MGFKDILSIKSIALCLSGAAVVGGSTAAIVESVTTSSSSSIDNPFVLIFKNGKNEDVNSDYRLMGRHQTGYINKNFNDKFGGSSFNSWETELGLELDNSNPVVQAEQLNWLYYLLFFNKMKESEKDNSKFIASSTDFKQNSLDSTFDGIRIDCGDAVDSDVIGQTAQLLNDLYDRNSSDANANDHLSYNEGYGPNDATNEKQYFHNSSLDYDDSYYQNMIGSLMWYDDNNLPNFNYSKAYIANTWEDDQTENEINPNITYSQNHDNFNWRLVDIANILSPGFNYKNFDDNKQAIINKSADIYYDKLGDVDKKYMGKQAAPKNQISLYADMLTNKDTVPIVFYGDIFESQQKYMAKPTKIAEPIMDILNARSLYASGGQRRNIIDNGDIVTNVRFGKNYFESVDQKIKTDASVGRDSGIATIFSNNKNIKNKTIKLYVGKNHAGQTYVNLLNTTSKGLGLTVGQQFKTTNKVMGIDNQYDQMTTNKDTLLVDDNGYISVDVNGVNTPFVDGYLSMWVPEGTGSNIYVSESEADNMNTFKQTHMTLNSNAALDSHVIYQDFSTVVPNQGLKNTTDSDQDNDQYVMLAKHAQDIANSGVTDIWMAPPYTSPDQTKKGELLDWVARYGYGYMMDDRYNLGEGNTPSKYGTADQLISATNSLHKAQSKISGRNLKTMLDFIPHQIIRGDEFEQVTYDAYDSPAFANPLVLSQKDKTDFLQTKTSDKNLQYKYGGKFLGDINTLFPDIFKTEALSTGEMLPYDKPIKNWSAKYEVAYPLEFGIGSYTSDNINQNEYYDSFFLSNKKNY